MVFSGRPRILDFSYAELKGLMGSLGESEFRADQIMGWVYKKGVTSFGEMTDLPQGLREKLEEETVLPTLKFLEEWVSADGMTRKALFELEDVSTIEAGYLMYAPTGLSRERGTVCVSSQVGCPWGCPFCATGQQGFTRNLTSGEIVEQVLYFIRRPGGGNPPVGRQPVTNVVFMGMGEPLSNYDNVFKSITMMNSRRGLNISSRRITLSSSGLVPEIKRLMRERLKVELAVSLHAPQNALRDYLVPVNRRYPLEELLSICREYSEKTGRRLTFEYILFKGLNDSLDYARELADRLKGLNAHVNLIIANPTKRGEFRATSLSQGETFNRVLAARGINSTVREPRGRDIEAGCGQLRSRYLAFQRK